MIGIIPEKMGADPPPPPYSLPEGHQHQQQHINRQFPPSFGLYVDSKLGRRYMLGEHQAQPLYAVSVHSGWSGQPSTVLHNGPTTEHPPLAGANASALGRSSTVELPPPLGGAAAAQQSSSSEERLESAGGPFSPKMRFTLDLDGPSAGRRETFEWRHSRGDEVAALGAAHAGWKLVRLGGGGGEKEAGGGSGEEIVAAWAHARMSLTKQLQFGFVGSGASGVLGERWAIMAVITALRIWDAERRRRSRNAASSGAGGGAAVSC
ncbi:hypothetical protein SLS62_005362 [Diatrype stigma]|uniref:Uncharacterized protein n=1 Tax=Diatrype stigma TaxID=117547 RepID=A0AAN9URK3_9PEZI